MRNLFLAAVAAALILPAGPAVSQDFELPARKPGQWEIGMAAETAGAGPDMTVVACVDAASDAEMMRAGLSMTREMCPRQEMRREGDAIVIETTCKIGPMDTNARIVITGDFQSAYVIETTTETTGGLAAMAGTNVSRQEARWVGAECTGGLAPGDMLMPGGMKMNVNDMMKMMGGQ
jgi:hypothetical protein